MKEYIIHKLLYNLFTSDRFIKSEYGNIIHIPKIFHYDKKSNILIMQKILGDNLSNIYGKELTIPLHITNKIQKAIEILHFHYHEFLDIDLDIGKYFMQDKGEKIWLTCIKIK